MSNISRGKQISQKIMVLMLCLFMAGGVAGCAKSADPANAYKSNLKDPLEPLNRGIFAFNNAVDYVIIGPLAKIYDTIFPGFVKNSVQSFMRNLKAPLIVANSLLQGDVGNAGVATARFIINTTVGIGGLVDVASKQGLAYRPEDLGQTLAVWGLGDGMYIVLPIIGPSSLRDTAGLVGDSLADPVRIYANDTDNMWIYYSRAALEGIDTRNRMDKGIRDLRRNSLDYYAAVRSAYAQKRQSLIRNENPDSPLAIPEYDEHN
jgi:phospholipid-binding lipoprotein MlaA